MASLFGKLCAGMQEVAAGWRTRLLAGGGTPRADRPAVEAAAARLCRLVLPVEPERVRWLPGPLKVRVQWPLDWLLTAPQWPGHGPVSWMNLGLAETARRSGRLLYDDTLPDDALDVEVRRAALPSVDLSEVLAADTREAQRDRPTRSDRPAPFTLLRRRVRPLPEAQRRFAAWRRFRLAGHAAQVGWLAAGIAATRLRLEGLEPPRRKHLWHALDEGIGTAGLLARFEDWATVATQVTAWFATDSEVWLIERPTAVRVGADHRLHGENAPAAEWADGHAVFALNGVMVPPVVATTPGPDLLPELLDTMTTGSALREFLRKAGPARVCGKVGRLMDRARVGGHAYELYDLRLNARPGGRRVGRSGPTPYLLMTNPSTGEEVVEGVHPECSTVTEALSWRNGTPAEPTVLT